MDYKSLIRVIPDFPKAGVSFKDITTLLKNGPAFRSIVDEIAEYAQSKHVDLIVGPEARGFVIGAPVAYAIGAGFVPIRKKGKLPAASVEANYDLEYGSDILAMHSDAISAGQRILLVDDLLATGGTIGSTIGLVKSLGGQIVGATFLIELTELNGREKLGEIETYSLITYPY